MGLTMVPPDERVQQTHEHVLAYALLEAGIGGERPASLHSSVDGLIRVVTGLRGAPECVIPDLLLYIARPATHVFQKGLSREVMHAKQYLPDPGT
jgi:hypothetical protein